MKRLAGMALLLAAGCAHVPPAPIGPPRVAAGDQWVYEVTEAGRGTYRVSAEVLRSDAAGIVVRRGETQAIYSSPWTLVRSEVADRAALIEPGLATIPFPLEVGRKLKQDVAVKSVPGGVARRDETVTTVEGWEEVVVPAGRFRALRVHREELRGAGTSGAVRREGTFWYVPEVRSYVKLEHQDARGGIVVYRLQSYRLR